LDGLIPQAGIQKDEVTNIVAFLMSLFILAGGSFVSRVGAL